LRKNIDFRREFQILALARFSRVLVHYFANHPGDLAHPNQRNLLPFLVEQSLNAARSKPTDEFPVAAGEDPVDKFFWARLSCVFFTGCNARFGLP
jgi:hypothetical protein